MRALSSVQIGAIHAALRDMTPREKRDVPIIVQLRTDHAGAIERPSRVVPAPRPFQHSDKSAALAAARGRLKDIERGMRKFGTGAKLQVRRPCAPQLAPSPPPPVLLLTDQRSARRKRLVRTEAYGPALPPHVAKRLAEINAAKAVQFGPWPLRIHNLSYEVIYV